MPELVKALQTLPTVKSVVTNGNVTPEQERGSPRSGRIAASVERVTQSKRNQWI